MSWWNPRWWVGRRIQDRKQMQGIRTLCEATLMTVQTVLDRQDDIVELLITECTDPRKLEAIREELRRSRLNLQHTIAEHVTLPTKEDTDAIA